MCIFFEVQLFRLVFFSFGLLCVKIINKILKMFCCLTLLCVLVCASRDGWLKTAISCYDLLIIVNFNVDSFPSSVFQN
jgi:hypothetical protein